MARTNSLADPLLFKAGFAHLRKSDPKLKPILDARGLIKFEPQGEPFESLVESILSQQLAEAVDALDAGPDPIVVHRQDVWPPESEDEKHVRRPRAYALHFV